MSPLEFPDWDQQWTPPATDAEYEAAYTEACREAWERMLRRVRQAIVQYGYDARPWWKKSPEDWPVWARWVWEGVR